MTIGTNHGSRSVLFLFQYVLKIQFSDDLGSLVSCYETNTVLVSPRRTMNTYM